MVDPKKLIETVNRLRTLVSAFDDVRIILAGSFVSLDPELEAFAGQVRPSVDISASLVYDFLNRLEQTPAFTTIRAVALEERYP